VLFKPESVDERVWGRLLSKVEEISGREKVDHDVCLIGSHARGDASPISDVDLVMFSDGESNLKRTEVFYVDEKAITMFPVNVKRLLGAKSIDFYNANNPFEARLILGSGLVLHKAREGVFGRRIDMDATRRIIGEALSVRLMSALSDATLDLGEGVRDMRVCLAKVKLYAKLFKERLDPWSIIPYRYRPEDGLEKLLEGLYYSTDYDELSSKLVGLDLRGVMAEAFRERLETMDRVVEKMVAEVGFAGKYVENYIRLYLTVEERVRSALWGELPGRWEIEELKQNVDHNSTNITCKDGRASWLVSMNEGGSLKIEHYGTNTLLQVC
jgi:predicted nucleotidyltransferase